MATNTVITSIDLQGNVNVRLILHATDLCVVEQHGLKKIASGKVREIYEIDSKTLLFVATDRISAYDVIMKNV